VHVFSRLVMRTANDFAVGAQALSTSLHVF
jgi:hypothetical protein